MKRLLRPLINRARRVVLPHAVLSYSQEGEDLILQRIFEKRDTGFYVDVGAHHPKRFSNTYKFYRRGWRGINIDATPGSMAAFRRVRPRDINLEMGIGANRGSMKFFLFNEPALNTFDAELADSRNHGECRITGQVEVPIDTLANVLASHVPDGQSIQVLSVDVEGLDLPVLESNDWQRFQPECICVEHTVSDLLELPNTALFRLLSPLGYRLFAKTAYTLFLLRSGV